MRWLGFLVVSASCTCGPTGLPHDQSLNANLGISISTSGPIVDLMSLTNTGCIDVNPSVDLDGTELTESEPGKWRSDMDFLPCGLSHCYCQPETWTDPTMPVDVPTSTLTLVSGFDHWTMRVERMFAQRTLTSLGNGVFRWSPETDVLRSPQSWLNLQADDGGFVTAQFSYDAGTLVITDALTPGHYIVVGAPDFAPSVPTCDGPTVCVAQPAMNDTLPAFDISP
jgi:hypothetical protein